MSYTKREFVLAAFEELGIAASSFDLQAADLENGLRRLDALIGTWNGFGVRLGYPLPLSPWESSLDDVSNVPDYANEAIISNLAVRIAPSFGKVPALGTLSTAKTSLNALLSRFATPPERQMPADVPTGAGYKPGRTSDPFSPAPSDPIQTGPEGELSF